MAARPSRRDRGFTPRSAKRSLLDAARLRGRAESLPDIPEIHFKNGNRIRAPFPEGVTTLVVGMGCFWGAEREFWQTDGVYSTAVGYAGGFTPHPTYREVCSGRTGHTEVVLIAFRPEEVSLENRLRVFWEGHDPTQGMQQGNDVGTQYRSAILTDGDAQADVVEQSRAMYQAEQDRAGHRAITTEVTAAGPFFYAEAEHRQYPLRGDLCPDEPAHFPGPAVCAGPSAQGAYGSVLQRLVGPPWPAFGCRALR